MTQKDPAKRFPSMQAVAETLEAFVHSQPASDHVPNRGDAPAGFTIEVQATSGSDKAKADSPRKTDSSRKEIQRATPPNQEVTPVSPHGTEAEGAAVPPMVEFVNREPQILQGTLQPAGQPAPEPIEAGDSGKLELGREVFTSAESNAELRHIREQRRQRQQQREKILWRVGLAVLVLLVLTALVFLVSQLFNSAPKRPAPKAAPPLVKPLGKRVTRSVDAYLSPAKLS